MSFPRVYAALEDMLESVITETSTARDIARKAGVRLNSQGGTAAVVGSFTLINDTALGYTQDYPVGVETFFPGEADTESMSRYMDVGGFTEARLLVTVTSAGLASSTLLLESDEASFSPALAAPLDAEGLHVGAWSSLEAPQDNAVIRWRVSNPSLGSGSFSVGLIQLQMR